MSKFIHTLALFIASAPLLGTKANAEAATGSASPPLEPKPVSLRPLNLEMDNLFAGHRSHSSHRSHASHSSHYSGSGTGSAAPSPPPYYVPTPAPTPTLTPAPPPRQSYSLVPEDSGADQKGTKSKAPIPAAAQPLGSASKASAQQDEGAAPDLTRGEKLRLQVMRVQIALKRLGLFHGVVDGVFTAETREALSNFQTVKNLPTTGMMTTQTMNALGLPAVN
ncbi:His-Xaa-Ser repeat protein HxsA [Paucibacter sp. DJ2R-2]|uniref:His-Xaa-Ser repeat protein HxsA n=1 Tax=Paucibacter sp. DJ2R-2 TaxID=2893558 RepID=UPI0021E49748|nr:His-Xaa-Ser repeat protein HxsA [Paucibacter sp. DJ2R-2]MCV2438615.1 His-Xaa-Ser repeat protein HxsA [Paucibacter sp. DJ2R-2]